MELDITKADVEAAVEHMVIDVDSTDFEGDYDATHDLTARFLVKEAAKLLQEKYKMVK